MSAISIMSATTHQAEAVRHDRSKAPVRPGLLLFDALMFDAASRRRDRNHPAFFREVGKAHMSQSSVPQAANAASRGYPDLHDHIGALREAGLLIEIDREINKDTEMHPLVRWQFRGGIAPEDHRSNVKMNTEMRTLADELDYAEARRERQRE
jgi:hypothetical protein